MLKSRIWSGVCIGGGLLLAVLLLPAFSPGILLLLLVIVGWGMHEFYRMLGHGGIAHDPAAGITAGVALVAATWWFGRPGAERAALALPAAVLAVLFVRQMLRRPSLPIIHSLGGTLLGVLYVAFLFNFLTLLIVGWGASEGRVLVMYLVVVVKCGDIGAYLAGIWKGRHKLIPRISPGKTWEGLAGGLAMGLAASLLWRLFSRDGMMPGMRFEWMDALILGLLLPAAGVFSDLAESLLKRAAGVKDSGSFIQGMGGVLDVLDSLLFAAPVLWLYASRLVQGGPGG